MADHSGSRTLGKGVHLKDEEVRSFVDSFFKADDMNDADERRIGMFTKDARAIILEMKGDGVEGIRKLRAWMKAAFSQRKHSVAKTFIGRFRDDGGEVEFMVQGQARVSPGGGGEDKTQVLALMAHGVLRPEGAAGWKLSYYRAMLVKEAEAVVLPKE